MHNKYFPTLVLGFSAAVLTTVPGVKNFACCLIVPLAAGFSIFIDQRLKHFASKVIMSEAVVFGILTGIFTSLFGTAFDLLITYLLKSNDLVRSITEVEKIIKNLPFGESGKMTLEIFRQIQKDITRTGFSWFYAFSQLAGNLFVYVITGLLGGLLGYSFINNRYHKYPMY